VPQPGIDYASLDPVPKRLYWSRGELFDVLHGGNIQGIVGNSVKLSFIALVGIIVFSFQPADRATKDRWSLPWLVGVGLTLAFSRSATMIGALVVVLAVGIAVLLFQRARTARRSRTRNVLNREP
jgi:exopolysaccharide production protein ExoQ